MPAATLRADRGGCQDALVAMTEPAADLPHEAEPEETVDAVPVLAADVRALEPARRQLPAVQAAAVAATGFVAGAATFVAIRHHRAARGTPGRPRTRRRGGAEAETLSVLGTRRFLVDVHLLGRSE
jgi:hypothetical protein